MTDRPDEYETPEHGPPVVHIPKGVLTKSGTYRLQPAVEFTDKMGAQWAILFLSEDRSECLVMYLGRTVRRVFQSNSGEWVSLAKFEDRFGVRLRMEEPEPAPPQTIQRERSRIWEIIAILLTVATIGTGIAVKYYQDASAKTQAPLLKKDTQK